MGRSFFWLGLTPALYTFGKMAGHSVARRERMKRGCYYAPKQKPLATRLGLIRWTPKRLSYRALRPNRLF